MDASVEFKLQILAALTTGLLFIGLAGWCALRTDQGRWATMGALGGLLFGATFAIYPAAHAERVFLGSDHLTRLVFFRLHVPTVLDALALVGAALLVAAFVLGRQRPVESDASLPPYGP